MPNEILTGARYPLGTDVPNIAQFIQNAVNDLADNTIPRFASPAARDTAFSSWVSAGNSMTSGLACFTQSDGRFWRYDTASSSWLYAGGNPPPIVAVTMFGGWSQGSGHGIGCYRDASGLVKIVGIATNDSAYNPQDGGTHTVFTLPAGYRPTVGVISVVTIGGIGGIFLNVTVGSDGIVKVTGGSSSSVALGQSHWFDNIPAFHPVYAGSVPLS